MLLTLSLTTTNLHAQDCPPVKISDFPAKDLPQSFDTAQLRSQASYKYYYGIGVPVDYVKARRLAFVEMKAGQEDPFTGSSILLMLYANGYGVRQDLDLCIRLACANVQGASAEIEGRMEHLRDLQKKPANEPFDICDDITSGYMSGFCEGLQTEKEDAKRRSKLDSLMQSWPSKDRAAYQYLRQSATNFFETRVSSEVDLSGTARVAFEEDESNSLEADLFEKLLQTGRCTFEQYSQQDFDAADKELNKVYAKLMHNWENLGTITKEGIRSTQRAWISYRDAWVTFAGTRCSLVTAASIKTLLTNERISQLNDLIELRL
jgi:uncharacterized protein YecT (DUF1311 family)